MLAYWLTQIRLGVCASVEPPWQTDESGNTYRCHIPPDELRALQAGGG